MKNRPTIVWTLDTLAFPITLERLSSNKFRVTYGQQVDNGLSYADACMKLGQAILHALNCEGKLDNDN